MDDRIKDKLREIERYLNEFKTIVPKNLDEYKSSLEKKAACERYFEKITESVTDLSFMLIKQKKLDVPLDDKGVFDILNKEGIIDKTVCDSMKMAKGMRNIIVHEYGRIDHKLVYESITKELISDVKNFISQVKQN